MSNISKRFAYWVLGVFATIAVAGMSLGTTKTLAADYPEKPIKWIVMWSAGGGMDSYTRAFTKYLEKEIGQPIVIQNITGGAGAIGYTAAKNATPDGYNLVTISSDMLRYQLMGTADIGVDDFDIVAAFAYHSPIIVVRDDSPFKTLDDVVAAAKESPGSLTVGVSDLGGFHHVPLMQLEESAGIEVKPVAHSGTAEITAAVMGGHLDLAVSSLKPSKPYLDEGKMRVLAHFATGPIEALPDTPSVKDLGYDAAWGAYGGFGGPKGLPEEAKATLLEATKKVWANPDFQKDLDNLGNEVIREGPEYRDTLLSLRERQEKSLEKLGIAKQ